MRINDRYAGAIRSSNLEVDERTTYSDTDVLGAMGLASRDYPLAVALERLFAGDNAASADVVDELAQLVRGKAPAMRIKVTELQATDLASACLAWHRDGVCKPCGGHGFMRIPGTTTIGTNECKPCRGVGKVRFETQFRLEMRGIAAWLVAQMEREMSRAGPAAMQKLAPTLDF